MEDMMKKRIHGIALVSIAGAALLAASLQPAWADDDWGPGRGMMGRWFMGQMMDDGDRWGFGPGMMMQRRFSDQWIESIKSELAITPEQEKLWTAYVTETKNARETMWSMHQNMMSKDIPEKLPERLALHESMIGARHESTKSVNAALLALYNAMSKEQQEKADGIFTGMGMM
jgi:hypothetical protein